MAETPVPDFIYTIPDDAPDAVKLHLRAQRVIQAAFYAFGDPDESPGSMSLGSKELQDVISYSLAMLLAADRGLPTRQDTRREAERYEKFIRLYAEALRKDTSTDQLLAHLGIATSKTH